MAEQAEAAKPATAASTDKVDAGTTPEIDIENVTLEQADQLFQTGSAELPVKGGKEKGQEKATPKAEDKPPGEKPAEESEKPKGEEGKPPPEEEEVVEVRTPDEIEAEATAAVEAVKEAGGDEDAQNEAAEEARKPKAAKTEEPPKEEPPPKKESTEPRRFRVKDPIAQAALELYKTFENTDTPITLAEAERRVRGGDAPKKEEPKAEETVDLNKVATDLKAEITELERKLDEAGENESLFTKDIALWTRELADKKADLKLTERDIRDAQELARAEAEEANTAFKSAADKSRAKAIEIYPDVANESTPLGKAVAERIVEMRDKNHPDHNVLFAGNAPEIITRMVAAELNIQPKAAPKAPPKEEPPPAKKTEVPPKSKKVTPVSGAKSAAGQGPKPEDAKKTVEYLKSDKATLEELDDAMGGKDPLSRLVNRAA